VRKRRRKGREEDDAFGSELTWEKCSNVSVRVSPISKTAAILIIALGIFTLVAGLTTGIVESMIAGVAITILGLVLYRLLFIFTRKLQKEMDGGTQPS
jgi:hypothetical protein